MIRNGTTLPGRSPAHQEVVGAIDQACAIWGLAGGNGRSRFIQHCLRYGLLSLLDAGVLELPEAADLNSCAITAKWRHGSRPPAPSQSSNRRPWFPRNRTEGLSTRGGAVPAVAGPASGVAGARLHQGCDLRAGSPRQNAFESSGLVRRNLIRFLSILAISGIACSGTSPASTPAATDFNRVSCPGLKSRCLCGLQCRTSASPQPHKQTGFWNHVPSAAALAFRTSHARLAPSILLVFIANLRLNSNTLRCSREMFSAGYGWPNASVWFSAWFSWCV